MVRTRATITEGEDAPAARAPLRGRGRGRGGVRGRGRARGAAPTRGRARELSPEPMSYLFDYWLDWMSRQKSYADRRVRPLEFMVGDCVWLKISPMKGVMRFGKKGKLSPRFVGPFEILRRVGGVAYKLALPPKLSAVHPVFHVSILRKYIPDESHVISYDAVELSPDLTYEEEPTVILDRRLRRLRTKEVASVKVQWQHRPAEEATWELESDMQARYPQLF
ncbi:uncharacterized protein LOC129898957, partial [Solanum dulcamara]|uniref:uncharacterized protein LOC129898954 n=1 Tax=Solanum dulcamara TaxID=45834 RepID=UPI0024863F1B